MAIRKSQIQIEYTATNADFNNAIKEMDAEVKTLNKRFSLQREEMKNTSTEGEKLAAEIENLKNKYVIGNDKIKSMQDALDNSNRVMGEGSAESKKWADRLIDAQTANAKVGNSIQDTQKKLKKFNDEVDAVDNGKEIDGLRKDVDKLKDSAGETNGAIGAWGDSFKNLLGAGAIGGVIAGVSAISDAVGGAIEAAVNASKDRAVIKYSMNLDEGSVTAVQKSMKTVEAYGIESQESLEGVRKQFLLNKDASNEANDAAIKGAGYLASAYSGLDFAEVIQETNEMASQFKISQEEALGMVDALLKVGFPPEQMDIISEYGNQLSQAGYEAEDIQAIFKAGIETGSWNIDKLLDGVKEGRIKLTQFATEIPEAVKPAIKSLGMTEEGFQSLAKEVSKGGPSGKKAMETVAKAVLDIKDKTKQAEAGTQIYGTLWEEQGPKIAEAIYNASTEVVTMTGNMDNLNKSIKGMDDEPAIRYKKAMLELDTSLMPVKSTLAEIVSGGLNVVNAAMEGTSISMKDLDESIAKFVESGATNAEMYGITWTELENGMVIIQDQMTEQWRYLTAEEIKSWEARKGAAETNSEAIATAHDEQMSTMALATDRNKEATKLAAEEIVTASDKATDATGRFATESGLSYADAKKKVEELAVKYGWSKGQVLDTLGAWEGKVDDFAIAHDKALGDAETAVTDYVTVATNGFSGLEQDESVSWNTYLKNLRSNKDKLDQYYADLKFATENGVDAALIQTWIDAGPEMGNSIHGYTNKLRDGRTDQDIETKGMTKDGKANLKVLNDTFRDSLGGAATNARIAFEAADLPGGVGDVIQDTTNEIVNGTPALKDQVNTTMNKVSNTIGSSLDNKREYVRERAKATGRVIEDEIQNSLDAVKNKARNLDWKVSRPELPKFTMYGDFNTRTGEVPRVNYSWYANGGYMDGTTLIGMGEAGAEGIVPLQGKHMMPFADAVAERMGDTNNNATTIFNISANISDDYDADRFARRVDKTLNRQSHEIKITKGR